VTVQNNFKQVLKKEVQSTKGHMNTTETNLIMMKERIVNYIAIIHSSAHKNLHL